MSRKVTLDGLLTHADLVEVARKWLARDCAVVITEMASYAGEEPDAIGWTGGYSKLLECKLTREDFLSDQKKRHRRLGMGQARWYLAPTGLIHPTELPPEWGLLSYNGRRVYRVFSATRRTQYDYAGEKLLLLSALRRIGSNCPTGISIKCYFDETQNRATLTLREMPS